MPQNFIQISFIQVTIFPMAQNGPNVAADNWWRIGEVSGSNLERDPILTILNEGLLIST